MDPNITIPKGWVKSYEDRQKIENLLIYQYINIGIGGGGVFINFVLLLTLISSKYFMKSGGLIILLCIGDLANCLYIFLQGYTRSNIYNYILLYQIYKIQTYWSCALMPFNWMGLLGSFIPHIVTFVMGLEKIIALKFPVIYKKYLNGNQISLIIFCLGYVVLAMAIAFVLAFSYRNKISKYWCGRKASYTSIYVIIIYIMNIIGYFVCFIITIIVLSHIRITLKTSLDKKKKIKKQRNKSLSDQERRDLKNYHRIKLIVIISFISSVTISVPSFLSLLSLYFDNLGVIISDPSDWISVFKSSINFFVYLFMNNDFKVHLYGKILRMKKYQQNINFTTTTKFTVMNTKKRTKNLD
uniref:G_PROTEIN_RECEP_F1_2 domain-containing protein n=1 Tax=Strongyloides stercoralis TaxID=6248 RepID=A0A0K0EK62_STRER